MIEHAFVLENGLRRMDVEMRRAHDELVRRGIPVELFVRKRLERDQLSITRSSLVVGDVPSVQLALERLGIEAPGDDSYPAVLQPFLLRRVWPSTLGEVERLFYDEDQRAVFVKPRDRLKRFTGFVLARAGDMAHTRGASRKALVWCAEVVEMHSEHRVFVIDGVVVGVRHYDGDAALVPDRSVIDEAVRVWTASGLAARGYGIDFAVLADGRTALVELNDGYGLGSYGLPPSVYLDLCIARWEQLTR